MLSIAMSPSEYTKIFEAVSFHADAGDILGDHQSERPGKTQWPLKAMSRIVAPDSGDMIFNDRNLNALYLGQSGAADCRRAAGYLHHFQVYLSALLS